MKYAAIFSILGVSLILLGCKLEIIGWLFFWSGISFSIVGCGYGGLGAKVFGKKSNGSISKLSLSLLLPYLLLTWIVWHIQRWISQSSACHQIIPGIWLGRRPFLPELPDNIDLIIDLTSEFVEPYNVIARKTYICIPTLDNSVPPDSSFQKLIEIILSWQGNIYIHCALGYGRSATVVAGILLAKGLVDNLDEAEKFIEAKRPGIKLSQEQKSLLKRVFNLASY
ncbi:MAG TPA: hypothetical protein DD000_15905 [Cyanobacteria bacterium UBA11166]|nr:hypothetical protein [Cyanobacteria bacterium UBA11166]